MDCSRFMDPVTVLLSELSTATVEDVLPPMSTVVSASLAGLVKEGTVMCWSYR